MPDLLRCGQMAASSLLACVPMLLARHPRTPLRVLCIGAFEYLARLNGSRLDRRSRLALAYACDFGALRNDFYDRCKLDRRLYRELRHRLRGLALDAATHRYIQDLRQAERYRPAPGPDGFFVPADVVAYRNCVLVLSLTWLQVLSGQLIRPRVFQALRSLVGLVQLVDDLFDWKEDWAFRRPSYVTAFLRDRALINRFRGLFATASERDPEAAPLSLAGGAVWLFAVALLRIYGPDDLVA